MDLFTPKSFPIEIEPAIYGMRLDLHCSFLLIISRIRECIGYLRSASRLYLFSLAASNICSVNIIAQSERGVGGVQKSYVY